LHAVYCDARAVLSDMRRKGCAVVYAMQRPAKGSRIPLSRCKGGAMQGPVMWGRIPLSRCKGSAMQGQVRCFFLWFSPLLLRCKCRAMQGALWGRGPGHFLKCFSAQWPGCFFLLWLSPHWRALFLTCLAAQWPGCFFLLWLSPHWRALFLTCLAAQEKGLFLLCLPARVWPGVVWERWPGVAWRVACKQGG
jgi:hypothetical protein